MFRNLLLLSLFVSCASKPMLSKYNQVGNANWIMEKDAVMANKGNGFLVSKESYKDFVLKVEFFAGKESNSGVFFRCEKRNEISDKLCYEANIFDTRPDQTYRTGGVVEMAAPNEMINTEDGKWHTYEITAKGSQIRVVLDGKETVSFKDTTHKKGPIALQFVAGIIKFRNVKIQKL